MSRKVQAQDFNSPSGWRQQAGEHFYGRGFSRAVWTQEAEKLSWRHTQVNAVNSREISKAAGKAVGADGGCGIHETSESSTPSRIPRTTASRPDLDAAQSWRYASAGLSGDPCCCFRRSSLASRRLLISLTSSRSLYGSSSFAASPQSSRNRSLSFPSTTHLQPFKRGSNLELVYHEWYTRFKKRRRSDVVQETRLGDTVEFPTL